MLTDSTAASEMTTQSSPPENGADRVEGGVASTSANESVEPTANGPVTKDDEEESKAETSSSTLPAEDLPEEHTEAHTGNGPTPADIDEERREHQRNNGQADIPLRGAVKGWETPPQVRTEALRKVNSDN